MVTKKPVKEELVISSGASSFYVDQELLSFDKSNPRFVDFSDGDETAIVKFLYEDEDLDELIQSISASGYIDYEPLLVMPSAGRYTVLEGNRRLAAVRLVRSKPLQSALGLLNIPGATPELIKSTDKLRVQEVSSREAARAYIGFKHINGPHKWNSLAKAKYAAEWLQSGGKIEEISRVLGDGHNTVRRIVYGWFVLKQAEANGFERDKRTYKRFSFSHLYTALTRPGYRTYIGLSDDPSDAPVVNNPIPKTHLKQLNDMMVWLYGDEKNQAIIKSQNPDVARLNEVLQHTDAKRYFLSTQSLTASYEIIAPKSTVFADALIEAHRHATRALSFVAEYDNDPSLIDNAKSLEKVTRILSDTMQRSLTQSGKGKR